MSAAPGRKLPCSPDSGPSFQGLARASSAIGPINVGGSGFFGAGAGAGTGAGEDADGAACGACPCAPANSTLFDEIKLSACATYSVDPTSAGFDSSGSATVGS